MCTVSWLYNHQGYHVFFNRDEQRSRAIARPPKVISNDGHAFIMPQDPQGQGTWMGVTSAGVSICLLNYYQGKVPSGTLISRGQLVRNLLEAVHVEAIQRHLNTIDLSHFAPFSLLVFTPNHTTPMSYLWTGSQLQNIAQLTSPYTSSGVDFPVVSSHRQASYQTLRNRDEEINVATLQRFHQSHLPEKSMFSVCMHRADAHTVSLSHIHVNQQQAIYEYWDGSPCDTDKFHQVSLNLKT